MVEMSKTRKQLTDLGEVLGTDVVGYIRCCELFADFETIAKTDHPSAPTAQSVLEALHLIHFVVAG